MSEKEVNCSTASSIDEVSLKDIQPNVIVERLPFDSTKCPLLVSQNGNATALYRYSNSGPFIELSDPLNTNLIPALKYSIIQGNFCIFNFGFIDDIDRIVQMLDDFQKHSTQTHPDLYNHIIHNSLMKQSFDTLLSLIPFDPIYEMVPEIYRASKASFRLLFFVQIEDVTKPLPKEISSLFNCMHVKP